MEIVQLTLGALGTNCYLVKREEGVLVIDPGGGAGAHCVKTCVFGLEAGRSGADACAF